MFVGPEQRQHFGDFVSVQPGVAKMITFDGSLLLMKAVKWIQKKQ